MLNEHAMPSGAYCCGVRCDSLELWNRSAAAMESQLKLDELRTAVFAMLAVLSKGVFDPGEYFDHDVRVMRAKEFSAARKAVEELL